MELFLDPLIAKRLQFLDPEIVKMVDRAFMWMEGNPQVETSCHCPTVVDSVPTVPLMRAVVITCESVKVRGE